MSDSKRLKIFTTDVVERIMKISACIDSFNSIKISGSILNPSNSINFERFSGSKFSIISAESAGSNSLRALFKKSVSLSLIFYQKHW